LRLERFQLRQGALGHEAVEFADFGNALVQRQGVIGERQRRCRAQGQRQCVGAGARECAVQDSQHAGSRRAGRSGGNCLVHYMAVAK